MKPKQYYFFIDETGDHGLNYVDNHFPLFLLAGCVIEQGALLKLTRECTNLKLTMFGDREIIFHSRDIRKHDGAFQVLFDLKLKQQFYEKLNGIIQRTDFTIISNGINKKQHIAHYGKSETNPYTICLSVLLENLIYYLEEKNDCAVQIVVEKRGKIEDGQLVTHYNTILDHGTSDIDRKRFRRVISGFELRAKQDNDIGLQLADLCAYPIARSILRSNELYIPFEIIRNKIYTRKNTHTNIFQ